MRVLLIEDDKKMADLIRRSLSEQSYAIDIASDAEEGIYLATECPFNLIVLDWMLPDKKGIEVCRLLRNKGLNTPILFLTALSDLKHKIDGFDAGADDYLSKPFAMQEFLARVRSLTKRPLLNNNDILQIADLKLNIRTRHVERSGRKINLTSKEFALLKLFMMHPDEVLTRREISESIWNDEFNILGNGIDVYVRYLRAKIQSEQAPLIHTVRGAGYVLKDSNEV